MKIKFLGTAAAEGVPALFCDCEACSRARMQRGKEIRTRSQAVIDDSLLIDFPPDTYMHILHSGLELHKITDIIITHTHSDHFYTDDIIMRSPGFSNMSSNKPLNIYGSNTMYNILNEKSSFIKMQQKGVLCLHKVEPFVPFTAAGYKITPLVADHSTAEDPFIYLIKKGGKTLLYAHDTGYFPNRTMEYLEKTDIKIDFTTFDCCYSLTDHQSNHLGLNQVEIMRQRLQKAGVITDDTVCCINHFSHNGLPSHSELSHAAKQYGFLTAFDNMEVQF